MLYQIPVSDESSYDIVLLVWFFYLSCITRLVLQSYFDEDMSSDKILGDIQVDGLIILDDWDLAEMVVFNADAIHYL